MSILGERINERLDALDQTQVWLGKEVGMRQQSIASIIAGKVKRPKKLREIAKALQTSEEYLLGETDEVDPLPPTQHAFSRYLKLSPDNRETVLALIEHLTETELTAKRRGGPKATGSPKRK